MAMLVSQDTKPPPVWSVSRQGSKRVRAHALASRLLLPAAPTTLCLQELRDATNRLTADACLSRAGDDHRPQRLPAT